MGGGLYLGSKEDYPDIHRKSLEKHGKPKVVLLVCVKFSPKKKIKAQLSPDKSVLVQSPIGNDGNNYER